MPDSPDGRPADEPLDTTPVLSTCDLCGCLVSASDLRAVESREDGDYGATRTLTICADRLSCFVRTEDPDCWHRRGVITPTSDELPADAPVFTCVLCRSPLSHAEAAVSRRYDEDGWFTDEEGGWWTEVICRDEEGCHERQYAFPRRGPRR